MTDAPRWHRARPRVRGELAIALGVVFAVAAAGFAVGGALEYSRAAAANADGTVVTATVVEVDSEIRVINRRPVNYSVGTIEYADATGDVHTADLHRRDVARHDPFVVGESFSVVYSERDPSKVTLAYQPGWAPTIRGAIGFGVCAVIAAGLLVLGIRRRRRRLAATGG